MKATIGIPTNLVFWLVASLMIVAVFLLVVRGPILSSLLKSLPSLMGSNPYV